MNPITKKILKVVSIYNIKYVTGFFYDEDNKLIDTLYYPIFIEDKNMDKYVEYLKKTYQENGVELIIEKIYKYGNLNS